MAGSVAGTLGGIPLGRPPAPVTIGPRGLMSIGPRRAWCWQSQGLCEYRQSRHRLRLSASACRTFPASLSRCICSMLLAATARMCRANTSMARLKVRSVSRACSRSGPRGVPCRDGSPPDPPSMIASALDTYGFRTNPFSFGSQYRSRPKASLTSALLYEGCDPRTLCVWPGAPRDRAPSSPASAGPPLPGRRHRLPCR